MIFDTHLHCDFSTDAHMKIGEAVEQARKAHVGIIVTEHWDEDYPTNPKEFWFDVNEYFERFLPYRNENVLLGIEIGMQKHLFENNERLARENDFDFVIGSMHCVNRRDLYEPVSYEGLNKQEAIAEFLEDSVANIRLHDNFDTFAHIDYMCRYMPYAESQMIYEEMPEAFDEVFRILIEKEKAIEINTRRLDDAQAIEHLKVLYKRFRELGGRYVTLGSDAHYVEHIGRRLDIATQIAEYAGLIPVYFEKRKMKRVK